MFCVFSFLIIIYICLTVCYCAIIEMRWFRLLGCLKNTTCCVSKLGVPCEPIRHVVFLHPL